MLPAEFFENHPLYKKLQLLLPNNIQEITCPAVHFRCKQCERITTFTGSFSNDSLPHRPHIQSGYSAKGVIRFARYTCNACKEQCIGFLVRIADDLSHVTKAGQYPPWSIKVEGEFADMLGNYVEIYQKGLICESQGYGIGAFAYYRRIVELIIDRLLEAIVECIEESDLSVYHDALNEAKRSIVAQEKIALVKDLLPASLRPDGMNPLTLLHDILSRGIHADDDSECLENAGSIRSVLVFLVGQIQQANHSKLAAKHFTEGMKVLLEKRTKRPRSL